MGVLAESRGKGKIKRRIPKRGRAAMKIGKELEINEAATW